MKPVGAARMSGSGGNAVIFVHGVGSTAAIWDYQLQALGESYRCFAVELRGNGTRKPEPPPQTITREGFVEDVLSVADAAQAGVFDFVGCSLGGVVGFELWRAAPERLRSLTFVGSFARYPQGAQYARSVENEVRSAGSMDRFAQARAAKLGLPPGARTQETIAQMACKSVESYVASTYATWTGDYTQLLPAIRIPVLVVCGANDAVAPPPVAAEIAQAIPGAALEILEGAGHVANADCPEHFNQTLRCFLERA